MNAPTELLGLPIPSDDPTFLAILKIHIAAGMTCALSGGIAASVKKRVGWHTRAGIVYCLSLFVVFASMTALSAMRWAENRHLFFIGLVAFASGTVGYLSRKRRRGRWLRVHIPSMGLSYVALLTGFYVDNGPNLPLWRLLPPVAFWFLPSLVGAPLVIRALRKWTPTRPPTSRGDPNPAGPR